MQEISQQRKNKILLSDYNFKRDIENRTCMAHFNSLDLDILEEILYSPLTLSVKKLFKSFNIELTKFKETLEKLSKTGLLTYDEELITINKEMRKYYESQVVKFDSNFVPGMEYLQALLKKVPIQNLLLWYAIPRTSNNIFDSIVEKYLYTPQTFQKHVDELSQAEPVMGKIINDVFASPNFVVNANELIEKHNLSRERFEEIMLYLEFSFICCIGYSKEGNTWKEVVTPYSEWRDYLRFLKGTEVQPIGEQEAVVPYRNSDFAFTEDMASVLISAKKKPIPVHPLKHGDVASIKTIPLALQEKLGKTSEQDLQLVIQKLCQLKLADVIDHRLYALESANDWLALSLESRAHFVYRHPLNQFKSDNVPGYLYNERNIRESEKSIVRVLTSEWVYFDDFLKGVMVPLSEASQIVLKKTGKYWKYELPEYTDEEKELIKSVVLDWLYQVGIIAKGTIDGKICFRVTQFGQTLFAR